MIVLCSSNIAISFFLFFFLYYSSSYYYRVLVNNLFREILQSISSTINRVMSHQKDPDKATKSPTVLPGRGTANTTPISDLLDEMKKLVLIKGFSFFLSFFLPFFFFNFIFVQTNGFFFLFICFDQFFHTPLCCSCI